MKTKTPKPPILPRSPSDPVGAGGLERAAIKDFTGRIRKVVRVYRRVLDRVPRDLQINAVYEYRLSAPMLASLLMQADIEVDTLLLEGGQDNLWFTQLYVEVASARGVAQAFANLAQQSPGYLAERESVRAILASDPYRQRMLLTRARVFEDMKALTAQAKADMARVLTDGLGRGLGPREIARNLETAANIPVNRAKTIARSEIPTALRRARLDEADAAETLYGVKTKEMHISALSPTTRKTHADRHGLLYTREQQRAWWAKDANSINCKCTTLAVLVDSKGNPLVPWIEQKAKENKAIMKARGEGPWTED